MKGVSLATLAVVKGTKYGGDVVGRTVNVDRHVKRSIAYDVLDPTDDALCTLGLGHLPGVDPVEALLVVGVVVLFGCRICTRNPQQKRISDAGRSQLEKVDIDRQ